MSKKSPAEVVQEWNAKYPIGTRVRFWPVRPTYSVLPIETRTTSVAYLMSDDADHASIMVEGLVGSVNLSTHVDALPDEPKPAPAEGAAEGRYAVLVERQPRDFVSFLPLTARRDAGTREEAQVAIDATRSDEGNAYALVRILPDGALEAALEAARREGAKNALDKVLAYVTGPIRHQFVDHTIHPDGLQLKDVYDDVRELCRGLIKEAAKGKAPT